MEKSALMGKWQLVSWTHKVVGDSALYYPFGKRPKGSIEFTDHEFMGIVIKDPSTHAIHPNFEDPIYQLPNDEYSTSGTYELSGDKISVTYKEAFVDFLKGQTRERTIHYDDHATFILQGQREHDGKVIDIRATYIRT